MENMRNYILLLVVFLFVGCDIEYSDNGDFDGRWHITSMKTDEGSVEDKSLQAYFWCVDTKLLQLRNTDGKATTMLCRFKMKSDSLFITEVHYHNTGNGDALISDTSLVYPYGLTQIPDTFRIISLSSDDMTLKSKHKTLTFEKY